MVRHDKTHLSFAESRSVGPKLASARRAAGLKASALARWLDLPTVTLGAYEAGRARIPLRVVFAAARALKASAYQLLAGRSDRVLNPWEPSLIEWQRLRRPVVPAEPAERERDAGAPVAGGEPGPGREEPEEAGGVAGRFEVLSGKEARRALAFLDERGPRGRLEEEGEESW